MQVPSSREPNHARQSPVAEFTGAPEAVRPTRTGTATAAASTAVTVTRRARAFKLAISDLSLPGPDLLTITPPRGSCTDVITAGLLQQAAAIRFQRDEITE